MRDTRDPAHHSKTSTFSLRYAPACPRLYSAAKVKDFDPKHRRLATKIESLREAPTLQPSHCEPTPRRKPRPSAGSADSTLNTLTELLRVPFVGGRFGCKVISFSNFDPVEDSSHPFTITQPWSRTSFLRTKYLDFKSFHVIIDTSPRKGAAYRGRGRYGRTDGRQVLSHFQQAAKRFAPDAKKGGS